jgi:invasion protein IalB
VQEDYRVTRGKWAAFFATAAIAVGLASSSMAADPAAKTQVFKQWTLSCATPTQAADSTTKPQPFCLIHHEVHPETDKTRTILIATTRYVGKDRILAMILRLPPVTNLQKGVVFNIDKNAGYKAKISSCTAELCTSLFQINDAVLKQMKGGTQMVLNFALTNGQPPMKLTLPLDGYAQAFDALQKTGL